MENEILNKYDEDMKKSSEIILELRKKLSQMDTLSKEVNILVMQLEFLNDRSSIMPYGKYAGHLISKIPDSYIKWLFTNKCVSKWSNLTEKFTLKKRYQEIRDR